MSNKHANIRYRVIDRCLRNRTMLWNWESLAEECVKELVKAGYDIKTLSERTIKNDISTMRKEPPEGYNAPIVFDRTFGLNNATYRYSDSSFSITESLLNQEEARQLSSVVTQIQQQTNLRTLSQMNSIFQKLTMIMSEPPEPTIPVYQLEYIPDIPGNQWIDSLCDYIRQENTINMRYRKFKGDPKSYIISPYMLKEYQNRWYLFAWSHNDKDLRTFGLERIENLQESFTTFEPNTSFDPTEYFKDIVGVSRMAGAEKERIVFRAYDYQQFYLKTKPVHPSQFQIRSTDSYTDFAIDVIPNRELQMAFFALGEELEILEPLSFRKSVAERIRKSAARYSDI